MRLQNDIGLFHKDAVAIGKLHLFPGEGAELKVFIEQRVLSKWGASSPP